MKLWLDDVRDPNKLAIVREGQLIQGGYDYTWAKTYEEAIAYLKTGKVTFASLDHDLTIDDTIGQPKGEKTGYDVVCWMEKNNVWPIDGVRVHSLNPTGKARMLQVIESYYANPYIICPFCGMKSYNPNDIREKYCGNCHEFHNKEEENNGEANTEIVS